MIGALPAEQSWNLPGRRWVTNERNERENLRSMRGQFNLEEPPPQVPLLCIDIKTQRFLSRPIKREPAAKLQNTGMLGKTRDSRETRMQPP